MRAKTWGHVLSSVLGLYCCACDATTAPAPTRSSPGVVAQVGGLSVTQDMLRLFEAPDEALLLGLVNDSLFAQEASRTDTARAQVVERAVLGRAMIEHLRDQTLQERAPTEDERAQVIAEQWVRLDHPRAVRTVVFRVPVPDLADDAPYRALAEKLQAAATGSLNLETALERTSAVDAGLPFERVRMPPVAVDGRVVPQNAMDQEMTRVDPEYAAHACALNAPAEVSPVFALRDAYQFLFSTEIVEAVSPDGAAQRREVEFRVAERRIAPELAQLETKGKKLLTWSEKEVPALLKLVWRE